MHPVKNPDFGKWRNFFWPIHHHELKKLLPMFVLFFLITFVYNILRTTKTTLVVQAIKESAAFSSTGMNVSGANIIPFLKVWAVLPGALIATYLFTILCNRLNRETLFYVIVSMFLVFFCIYGFVLYPHRQALELTRLSLWLKQYLPLGLSSLADLICIWPSTLFYVIAETWSTIALSVLFWGFANEVTSVDEAKRFYAIFALGSNASGIFSGRFGQYLSHHSQGMWDILVRDIILSVFCFGLVIMILFRILNVTVLRNPRYNPNLQADAEPPAKTNTALLKKASRPKVTLFESFVYLARSQYMLYLSIIVVGYNIVYNLADVLFTHEVEKAYMGLENGAIQFNNYMNNVISITGVLAVISAFFVSGNVIRRFGWTKAALITPIIWLLTSVGFFIALFLENTHWIGDLKSLLGVQFQSLNLILIFAAMQISLGRASKYTVFDETKEIVYIPLNQDSKRKGKAVIDGIGSRFGKSGGSMIYQILLPICGGNLDLTVPYVALILLIVIGFWIYAVFSLGKLVNASIDQGNVMKDEHEAQSGKKRHVLA